MIRLGSRRPTRDFSYVQDTVGGFIAALEADNGLGEVVNLGSGFEISIGDTLSLVAELMQVEVEVKEENEACARSQRSVSLVRR